MKKSMIAFSIVLMVFGMIVFTGLVLAEKGSDSKVEGSAKTSIKADYDKDGTKIVTKTITEIKDGKEVKRDVVTRIKNGKIIREISMHGRKFVDADGKEKDIKVEIRERNEMGMMKKFFRAKDGGIEAKSDLEISENTSEDGNIEIEAKLKDGKHKKIKVLPDRASDIAKNRLRMIFGNDSVEIREIEGGRVVYHLEGNSTGKFLGIFKTHMKSDTDIDAETGNVIVVHRPWWAFLVSGKEGNDVAENDTITTPVADDNSSDVSVNDSLVENESVNVSA